MKKLSKAQQEARSKLTDEWQSAYGLQVGLRTLYALERWGLAESQYYSGSCFSPRARIGWRLKQKEIE